MAVAGKKNKNRSKRALKPSELISIGMTFRTNPEQAIKKLADKLGLPLDQTEKIVKLMHNPAIKDQITAIVMAHIDEIMAGRVPESLIDELSEVVGVDIKTLL